MAKSPTEFRTLSMTPSREAFSCSRTEEELQSLGHQGALSWIQRFSTAENIQKLSKNNLHWYEMNTDSLADLVMFINYGDRLFVGRVNPPSFADQRLVTLKPRDEQVDIDLHHALLNTAISMFMIEGMGFGRGLGALDLNKDRIENYMHILDANQLNADQVDQIKAAFLPLTQRGILPIADELEQSDRIAFDDAVIEAFRLQVSRTDIYNAVLSLAEIRRTASE
ncbi:hypothetical protein [Niabella hibiscisoli]|uniref:hypothetical protein n=1 Tax=Niabella hibiscisoli TaxID=1825928 RepID=UPI001F0F224E|nr:hypothetical protein [Niabella hibiscisoli]MCH5716680.1 hypothetical protein [Niabella hibiscisoli]